MAKIDLLSVGDASLDVFIDPSESEALCNLDDKDCLICFSYGDKIPVKHTQFSIGGNAANNAVGTKRLGVSSAAVLTLGSDEIGDQIKNKLKNCLSSGHVIGYRELSGKRAYIRRNAMSRNIVIAAFVACMFVGSLAAASYTRIGGPLNLIFWALAGLVIPLLWPF